MKERNTDAQGSCRAFQARPSHGGLPRRPSGASRPVPRRAFSLTRPMSGRMSELRRGLPDRRDHRGRQRTSARHGALPLLHRMHDGVSGRSNHVHEGVPARRSRQGRPRRDRRVRGQAKGPRRPTPPPLRTIAEAPCSERRRVQWMRARRERAHDHRVRLGTIRDPDRCIAATRRRAPHHGPRHAQHAARSPEDVRRDAGPEDRRRRGRVRHFGRSLHRSPGSARRSQLGRPGGLIHSGMPAEPVHDPRRTLGSHRAAPPPPPLDTPPYPWPEFLGRLPQFGQDAARPKGQFASRAGIDMLRPWNRPVQH